MSLAMGRASSGSGFRRRTVRVRSRSSATGRASSAAWRPRARVSHARANQLSSAQRRRATFRDKAKVETAVQIAERWILAKLRNQTFFSLADLNSAIRELVEEMNNRPFQKLPGSRRSRFEENER